MARVPFRCPLDPSEWVVVEMQGQLESTKPSLAGVEAGVLEMEGDTPVLVIGNHRLRGAVAKLPKPLVVTRTVPAATGADGDSVLDVVGVVRTKYVFKKRPDPVLSAATRAATIA